MADATDAADRFRPLFDHTHDTLTTAIVVVSAALVGLLAGWVSADFGVRSLAFVVAAIATGYLLYGQPTRRAVVAGALYFVAAMVAVAPLLLELATVVNVSEPARHVMSPADLLLAVPFWLLATLVALLGYRVGTGPLLPRLRGRL
ncbi:hypothetical protein ACKVMT_03345 [Halobacteriales archaeon Cl-PHB]